MIQARLLSLILVLVCLCALTPAIAEDNPDGFVPATGNQTQTSAPAVDSTAVSAPVAPSSSGSAQGELGSALRGFFEALSRLFEVLSQFFAGLFGGPANAASVPPSNTTASTPASSTASAANASSPENAERKSILNEVRYGITRLRQRINNHDPEVALTVKWVTPYLQQLKALNNPEDAALIKYSEDSIAEASGMAKNPSTQTAPTQTTPDQTPPSQTTSTGSKAGTPPTTTAKPPSTPAKVLPSGFVNPCPAGRLSPYAGDDGCDIHAPVGTPVYAAKSGVVVYNDPSGHSAWEGSGNNTGAVRIRHSDGTETWYAHLSGRNLSLKPGMKIQAGTPVGNVGVANGVPHLHMSVFYSSGGDSGGFMDPFAIARALRG